MKFVSIDPGESLGYAVWDGIEPGTAPTTTGTVDLWDFIHGLAGALGVEAPRGPKVDEELVKRLRGIRHVVIEDWVIYPWKAKDLAFDPCRTARGIGAIELVCGIAGIPYTLQGAKIKEPAEAAGAAEFFSRPLDENRHANDAVRHGVYFKAMRSAAGA